MGAQTTLAQATYQGYKASDLLPLPKGTQSVTLKGVMADKDASNSSLTCTCGIDLSTDGGKTWSTVSVGQWVGGTDPHGNPAPPGGTVTVEDPASTHARFWYSLPTALSVGIDGLAQ